MIDSDVLLVLGVVLAALAIPSMMAAYADERRPRLGAVICALGLVLMAVAYAMHPGGYSAHGVAEAFTTVLAQIVR